MLAFATAKCHAVQEDNGAIINEHSSCITQASIPLFCVVPLDNRIGDQVSFVKEACLAQPAFGLLLESLREERGLSLRELGQLADIDHAYIYRLEAGDKESPSEDALA